MRLTLDPANAGDEAFSILLALKAPHMQRDGITSAMSISTNK